MQGEDPVLFTDAQSSVIRFELVQSSIFENSDFKVLKWCIIYMLFWVAKTLCSGWLISVVAFIN